MAESVSLSERRSESKIVSIFPKHFYLLHTKMFTFHVWNNTMGNKKGGYCWCSWHSINRTKVVNCWFSTPIRMQDRRSEVHKQILNYKHTKVIPWYLNSLKTKVCFVVFQEKITLFGTVLISLRLPIFCIKIQ